MAKKINGHNVVLAAEQKNNMWIRIAGGVALLAVGFLLYKKRQTGLGSALMTTSLNVLTEAASAAGAA